MQSHSAAQAVERLLFDGGELGHPHRVESVYRGLGQRRGWWRLVMFVTGVSGGDADAWQLPSIGEVYWVLPWIFLDGDPKEERPAVVVRPPRAPGDLVTVVERTSTRLELRGIAHPADPAMGLDRPGVWAHRFTRAVEERLFRPPNVRLVGVLASPYLDDVLRMWEEW